MYGAIPHTENNYYYLFNFETAIRVKVIWILKNTSYGNGLVVTFKMFSCICIWQDRILVVISSKASSLFTLVTTLFCLRSKLLAATLSFGEGISLPLVKLLLVVDKGAEDFAVLALVESCTAFHSSSRLFWLAKNFSYGWSLSLTSVSALCSAG